MNFESIEHVASDGFGPIAIGRRGGRRFAIRTLANVPRRSISDAEVQRLGNPPHPAILPVEVGVMGDGIYLAAPCEGGMLSLFARRGNPGAAEIGALLLGAMTAVHAAGDRLGPISWNDIYIDEERPGLAWIFPIRIARTRSADWLRHDPKDLWFVDRDTLRQAPSVAGDQFSIGAILCVLVNGAAALPKFEGDAATFIRSAVIDGVTFEAAAKAAKDLDGFVKNLATAKSDSDPMQKALALHRAGKSLDAMKTLHKAVQEGGSVLPLQMLKAHIEIEQRLVDRAMRTLREAHATNAAAGEVIAMLANHATDGAEAADFYAQAMKLDPIDLGLQIGRARALERAGKLDDALEALDEIRAAAAIDPSRQRDAARAAVRMGRLLIDKRHNAVTALGIIEPYVDDDDPELRAEALAVKGSAHAELGAFAQAEQFLREALDIEKQARPTTPRPFVLNHLAHALVATGKHGEAKVLVKQSLDQDPGQENLWKLLAALGGG